MRSTWMILFAVAIGALLISPALAQDANGTLYDQEGTANDGYSTINAQSQGPANASTTNWKYQYGSGSYSGVYKKSGWLDISDVGDSKIDIECDIEMYYEESFSNNKIYVHLGDPFNATSEDKTAYVDGYFRSNNGMYIGISFDGTSKTAADMLKDASGNYTGEVRNAMVGTKDVLLRDISDQAFNARFTLSWSNDNGDTWSSDEVPTTFGTGASGTVLNTLWWKVNNGDKGAYLVKYKVELLPPADQADGNYHFDPAIVAAPVL
ncbi:MAG: hypothetical protein BIFFINMI_00864 [Phycisphaerae bacterium]|nr:hypothetical protein [Phycisphaerae bacterium]